ncbi:hypothetical protein FJZ19_04960 [Candidatus Pacearchaeota archaeon]|nr:hypothetical protein [Candidatus Pacearchaeota archaeon]
MKKSQVSIEYLIIVGFVTFILLSILAIAFLYSGTIKDQIKVTQLTNFANKITSSAEAVFYSGKPSKTTITVYLPEGVLSASIVENSLLFSIQTSSGVNIVSFSSNVPISGTLSSTSGVKKIEITAQDDKVLINPV